MGWLFRQPICHFPSSVAARCVSRAPGKWLAHHTLVGQRETNINSGGNGRSRAAKIRLDVGGIEVVEDGDRDRDANEIAEDGTEE